MALYHEDKKNAPSSAYYAADSVFTTLTYGARTNDTLSISTPRGALGGQVATISGADNTVVICDGSQTTYLPIGLFYNDAAGGDYENAPATASGKIAILPLGGGDYVYVDTYETRNAADSADLTYAVGDAVYTSANGFLTNEQEGSAYRIGTVAKVPSTTDARLGVYIMGGVL